MRDGGIHRDVGKAVFLFFGRSCLSAAHRFAVDEKYRSSALDGPTSIRRPAAAEPWLDDSNPTLQARVATVMKFEDPLAMLKVLAQPPPPRHLGLSRVRCTAGPEEAAAWRRAGGDPCAARDVPARLRLRVLP